MKWFNLFLWGILSDNGTKRNTALMPCDKMWNRRGNNHFPHLSSQTTLRNMKPWHLEDPLIVNPRWHPSWSRYQCSCERHWKQWQRWGAIFKWLHRKPLIVGKKVAEERWGEPKTCSQIYCSWASIEVLGTSRKYLDKKIREAKGMTVAKGAALSLIEEAINNRWILFTYSHRLVWLREAQIWLYRALLGESGGQLKTRKYLCLLTSFTLQWSLIT